jgi:hypothetical protein
VSECLPCPGKSCGAPLLLPSTPLPGNKVVEERP